MLSFEIMGDLFDRAGERDLAKEAPLAMRMRPRSLFGFFGQEHLVGEGKFLRRIIEGGRLVSLILWGPPGSGKTTLARIIAESTGAQFEAFSAVLSGVDDLRRVIADAKDRLNLKGERTILFVDEIHRWNKAQQDAFLGHVESGLLVLIGATTENPSFEVIAPLLSRCRVCVLNRLKPSDIEKILDQAIADRDRGLFCKDDPLEIEADVLKYLASVSDGDARRALNALELADSLARAEAADKITELHAREALTSASLLYDKAGEEHYNLISAFIKSLRGSDPDAAIYWMVRMLESGEDPLFILRRMVIFAAEDIGNADPEALQVAVAAQQAFSLVGLPEGRIPMAQAVTYLASAPKSNASYKALNLATDAMKETGSLPVPPHLRNPVTPLMKGMGYGKDYKYPHHYDEHFVSEDYLPDDLKDKVFYQPADLGKEQDIKNRLEHLRNRKKQAKTEKNK
jgi:putative ATPase